MFGKAAALERWFSLLLLHSEVATLAGPYFDFATLAGAALEATAAAHGVQISARDKQEVLEGMRSLPPHPEVPEALARLRNAGLRLVTLTNSSEAVLNQQIANAGLSGYFERNFSVDAVRRYKPAPEPYRMVASALHADTAGLRLVAAHAWDTAGAMQAGCAAAFVARPGHVLFPLGPQPDISGPDLLAVAEQIIAREIGTA